MKSIGTMIQELFEYKVKNIMDNMWESDFIGNMYRNSVGGKETTSLSDKQLDKIEQLHQKYCGKLL